MPREGTHPKLIHLFNLMSFVGGWHPNVLANKDCSVIVLVLLLKITMMTLMLLMIMMMIILMLLLVIMVVVVL